MYKNNNLQTSFLNDIRGLFSMEAHARCEEQGGERP